MPITQPVRKMNLCPSFITGLCTKMQAMVEKEVLRSQAAGLMSTKVRNVEYLQDPQIVNAAKPHMPNPY